MTIYPQPKPDSRKYQDLINDIDKGIIKIPKFQREFVWPIEKTAALLDSIVKGYPIGTFIIWKTDHRMGDVKNIGNIPLPATPKDRQVEYVLDGQQRMTSLFAAFRGAKIQRANSRNETNFSEIYVDLASDLADDDQIVITKLPPVPHKCVPLGDIIAFDWNVGMRLAAAGLSNDDLALAGKIKEAFTTYDFSLVTLTRNDIDSAIEVFTRINTGGSVLTLFEIMVAKTYDEERKFDMQERWNALEKRMKKVGFNGVSPSTILSLLSLILSKTGECKRTTILGLEKEAIIDEWDAVVSSLEGAIDYVRRAYRIPVSSLLPYDAMLVPLAYFLHTKKKAPSGNEILRLREFFWRAALTSRYSASSETMLSQDKRRMDEILTGDLTPWADLQKLDIENAQALIETNFSTSNARCKAILCLLAHEQPKDFDTNGTVSVDNVFLKTSASRNYHHFFPRSYLTKAGIGNENSVVNITLVSDQLNKHEIRARAPKDYIIAFQKTNRHMVDSLASHMIDRHGMGIDEDDYGLFLAQRGKKIWAMIEERVNPVFATKEADANAS